MKEKNVSNKHKKIQCDWTYIMLSDVTTEIIYLISTFNKINVALIKSAVDQKGVRIHIAHWLKIMYM